MVRVSFHN